MAERAGPVLPWTLIAGNAVLLTTLVYVVFMLYWPAQQRVSGLETELRGLYAREAELQTELQKELRAGQLREHQIASFAAERQALIRRVDELEKQLASRRRRR